MGVSSCVLWCGVMLPYIGSSSIHPLDLGQHYLIKLLSMRPNEKMNGGITTPSLVITPNTMLLTVLLFFINLGTTSGYTAIQLLFLRCSPTDPRRIFSRMNKASSVWGDAWFLSKLRTAVFLLVFNGLG